MVFSPENNIAVELPKIKKFITQKKYEKLIAFDHIKVGFRHHLNDPKISLTPAQILLFYGKKCAYRTGEIDCTRFLL